MNKKKIISEDIGIDLTSQDENHDPPQPHVVIVGAGFGGLAAARALAKQPMRITVIDRRNHHLFQPLLYQVATAGLAGTDITSPIRHILSDEPHTETLMADVKGVDPQQQTVIFLIGFRNRVSVLLQWAWSYLTFQRGARLITFDYLLEEPEERRQWYSFMQNRLVSQRA